MKQINIYITILVSMILITCFSIMPLNAVEKPGLHEPSDQLLQKYVKGGMIDYKGFGDAENKLNLCLAKLEAEDFSNKTRPQKLAFWINAYNAFTVKLILNHYPTESISNISRPWKRRIWKAAGRTLSLDDIEHKILRKVFREPRIHFAIVCAGIGCPDLQSFAYRGDKIERK